MGNLTPTRYIVKMFEYIAADVETKTGIQLHYEHGHPIEIDNILKAWGNSQDNSTAKYPLLALFQDFDEKKGTDNWIDSEVSLELIIATMTDPNYTAGKRMEQTFVPQLYPLYRQFLESIAKSGYFMEISAAKIKHTKTDRMFWGRNNKAVFGDYVDAIHITNLELRIKKFNCT